MPRLSYPFRYECSACGSEVTINRWEARYLAPDPDLPGALEIALQSRGWLRDENQDLLCPSCAENYFC